MEELLYGTGAVVDFFGGVCVLTCKLGVAAYDVFEDGFGLP